MGNLLNRVRVTVTGTPGTGTVTLSGALTGFQTMSAALGSNGKQYSYLIEEGTTKAECGVGTWNSTANTFTRDTVLDSTAGYGVKVAFTSAAIFSIVLLRDDIEALEKRANAKSMAMSLIFGS